MAEVNALAGGAAVGPEGSDDYFWTDKIIHALEEAGMIHAAGKLKCCGQNGFLLTCEMGHKFFITEHCDLRICPSCSERYGKRLWKRYADLLPRLAAAGRRGYGLKFVTLTKVNAQKINNPEELRKVIKRFFKDVRSLMKRIYPKKRDCGALAVLEVTAGFMVHCHAIVYGPYVDQAFLSRTWLQVTGDSRIVDIRRVRGRPKNALGYLLKYIFKPCNFDEPRDYAIYLAALQGVRRVHSFGIFYNFKAEEEERPPVVCPECGSKLYFDRDFYFEYGHMRTHRLRYMLGIEPLVAR